MNQHASLSPGRWSAFSLDRQILMIGNEMNRAAHLLHQAEKGLRTARPLLPPGGRRRVAGAGGGAGQEQLALAGVAR
jgi:hypothetical protein